MKISKLIFTCVAKWIHPGRDWDDCQLSIAYLIAKLRICKLKENINEHKVPCGEVPFVRFNLTRDEFDNYEFSSRRFYSYNSVVTNLRRVTRNSFENSFQSEKKNNLPNLILYYPPLLLTYRSRKQKKRHLRNLSSRSPHFFYVYTDLRN